ncbi:DUF421 domain-containing protein [Bacillus cereus group sp. MYBK249-1]|uniref:DUF421 domain-containing protein n=1 Tax=Bacillus TaxID=1386 RepID=UPI002A31B202|nr:DUF421 domain-containing protein [Bacillus cereus]MDA2074395.1 DUF421 domain-containing protein [Bacillus cereus]MDA2490627.1 DUF421 domain-containing protein [Bacillus cereus]HDR4464976.1 DUF421 domain-containing protein [Bacillus cereus]HDR6758768.1 DUF421 domain-containing protein [Bacillus cereus]
MKYIYITTELISGFFLLFIIVKFVGRKIINQITPFTFISAIVLGELLGNAIYDQKISIFTIVYSMTLWGLLLFIVEYLGQKFLFFRGAFEGKPSALIKNGIVDREELKKNKMNISQLQSLLWQSETFSIREVAFCYLEVNGSISILKKTQYKKTTREDFNMPDQPVYVPVTLIRDGKVLWDELKDLNFSESWLETQLISQKISNYEDVFLAEWLEGDGLFIQKNN